MAEDPREPSSSQEPGSHLPASFPNTDPKKPKHDFPQSQVGKLWDAFGNPEEPVNALANASYKPRGQDPKDVSYSDVVGTVSMSEISSFYKVPCARESLLTGIGAGFGIGGVRAVFGGMSMY
jgi:cytochrome c oxidase assembly protein subunit 20